MGLQDQLKSAVGIKPKIKDKATTVSRPAMMPMTPNEYQDQRRRLDHLHDEVIADYKREIDKTRNMSRDQQRLYRHHIDRFHQSKLREIEMRKKELEVIYHSSNPQDFIRDLIEHVKSPPEKPKRVPVPPGFTNAYKPEPKPEKPKRILGEGESNGYIPSKGEVYVMAYGGDARIKIFDVQDDKILVKVYNFTKDSGGAMPPELTLKEFQQLNVRLLGEPIKGHPMVEGGLLTYEEYGDRYMAEW